MEGNVVVDLLEIVPGLQVVPPWVKVRVCPSKLGLVVITSPKVRPLGSLKRVLVSLSKLGLVVTPSLIVAPRTSLKVVLD